MVSRSDDSVFASLQQVSGATYDNAQYNRDIIDVYLLRKARQKGIRLPTGGPPKEYKYLGAHVEQSIAGTSENVVYIDVSSMYPSFILTLNASPETIIGTRDDLRESEYTEDDCVWGYIDTRPVKHLGENEPWGQYTDGQYKMVYDPETPAMKWSCDDGAGPRYEKVYFLKHDVQKGFLTECVEELIALKNQYRGTSLYGSTKRITNSLYGVLGFANADSSFRLFDWRIAEAITLSGRKMIQFSRDYVIDKLAEMGYEAYAALGDTDGVGIAVPEASTRHEAMELVEQAVEQLNGPGYDDFFQREFGVPPDNHHGEIEIESYSPKVFIPSRNPPHGDVGVKKRRVQWETWNDDDGETDSVSITGLEAERSDVAPITKQAQRAFATQLRNSDSTARENLFPTLREYADAIADGRMDVDRVCKRGGIGQPLGEYGTADRTPAPLYRGAKYASRELDGVTVQHGDKPRLVYVDSVGEGMATTYRAQTAEDGDPVDAIAVNNVANIPADVKIDWDRHLQKTLIDPLKPLLETRFGGDAWSEIQNSHRQTGLDKF